MQQVPSIAEIALLARSNDLVGYFGYGSLVNRATLRTGIVAAWPARLGGWRRTWRPRPEMERESGSDTGQGTGVGFAGGLRPSLLSAHPVVEPPSGLAPKAGIDGLLVIDFAENLAAVDAREFRYHRRDISLADLTFASGVPAPAAGVAAQIRLHVYEARHEPPPVNGPSPILRSYLDAVMQGFYREFGPEGVHRFVTETHAFDTPIHEDRHAPLYPRAVKLSPREIGVFEAALGRR
ncbi:gamma-glutamylcyclotransferase [Hoeflea sp. YIM 152468]|uniref:gamma-glutamylcyclotransferase n=1 Tax=Hoeflea sp. YIM 152468 TaxID=3031759 RepID=UPI0023DA089D|nr:gamma-glutamylcyclotransferase [Hoeflea sp. YIM 152468]MDF1607409.1 gamma-glutamylcyclotransferase [Hoeflea sp. YIM 152468]